MVGEILPWVLEGVELGGPVLEIGPGPGLVTEALVRYGVADLTTLEIEPEAAQRLRRRYGKRVQVETGDAAAMPFPEASFAAVVCCTMLHHVPTPSIQDRVLAEARRVLRPGGTLAGSDSRTGLGFRLIHLLTCTTRWTRSPSWSVWLRQDSTAQSSIRRRSASGLGRPRLSVHSSGSRHRHRRCSSS